MMGNFLPFVSFVILAKNITPVPKKSKLYSQAKCEEIITRIDEIDTTYLSQKEHLELQLLKDDLQAYVGGYRWAR